MAKPVDMPEEAHPEKRKFGPSPRRRANPTVSGADDLPADKGGSPEAGVAGGDDVASNTSGKQIAPDAVKQWARQLNVPAARLRQAIWRVGPLVDDVKRFLANSTH
jgi:hypothetical protein